MAARRWARNRCTIQPSRSIDCKYTSYGVRSKVPLVLVEVALSSSIVVILHETVLSAYATANVTAASRSRFAAGTASMREQRHQPDFPLKSSKRSPGRLSAKCPALSASLITLPPNRPQRSRSITSVDYLEV